MLFSGLIYAQNAPPASPKPHYCNETYGFCVDYPASWKLLGEVYEGHGAAIAPVQKGNEARWDSVTVAAVEIPAQEGKDPATVEDLVTSLIGKMAAQTPNMQTVRRSEETLAHHPAQLVQVRYDENNERWGETIVAMDGGNDIFYTVVFKCRVLDEAKYQAAVEGLLKSFRLTQ
ncbi:MAG TPA: hypothetical protein VGL89_09260 [Candidatus Koribacter sp.]|jgi:hypothetical protein